MKKAHPALNAISEQTTALWYRVNKKYGEHVYTLGVNGLGEVVLCKGYGETIAKGNRQAQQTMKRLLAE